MAIKSKTKTLLRERKLRPKKRFGQNFLVDDAILDHILDAAKIAPGEVVLEIGPGTGNLTERLLNSAAKKVISVELDRDMAALLKKKFQGNEKFQLVEGNFLDLNLFRTLPSHSPIKVVANIPYYITSPIIMKLLDPALLESHNIKSIFLMVQKEVADRLSAPPGGKEYGVLSIATQVHALVHEIIPVPRTAFYPVPKVDSTVVRLEPFSEPRVKPADEKFFFRVVKGAFSQRRRTLRNALMGAQFPPELLDTAFQQFQIDPIRRGETLSIDEFMQLSDFLHTKMTA